MHATRLLTLIILTLIVLLLIAADSPPPNPATDEIQAELSAALAIRLQKATEAKPLTFDLFIPELDTAFISPDGNKAVLWLRLRDETGRILGTEPGLALAIQIDTGWQVLLPGDYGWEETITSLPDWMLPLELSPSPKDSDYDPTSVMAPLTGYYLPYAAGTSHWLEGSISHFQSIPELGYPSCTQEYCRYAYDFTDADHFPLLASKGGSVVGKRDSCSDGNPGCTNYIVMYNSTEQTYQIYLHLAHGTIPSKLTAGVPVLRGQYLGDTDDTGYSTSQHVHFMVTTSIWLGGDGYYWGRSIDIRFADVAINNGIPRTCYEVTHFPIYDGATECMGNKSDPGNPANDWFVSENIGAFPPNGTLTQPAAGTIVATGSNTIIDVTALTSDDVRVTAVRMVAKLNGQWVEIGPLETQPIGPNYFDWDVNLCAAAPVNGPLEVALKAWDHEGNVSDALDPHIIQVDHACPPPSSLLKPAERFESTAVRLSWEATNAGAGLGSFNLQWRTDPGTWDEANMLIVPGNVRSTWFAGQAGGTYAFRLRALDTNNQPESWPSNEAYETSATLPATCTPDIFESDNDSTLAKSLTLGQGSQRNFCGTDDTDWFVVNVLTVGNYFFSATSKNGGAAVKITVYTEYEKIVLAEGQAAGLGQDAVIRFPAEYAGKYYFKVKPLTQTLMGTDAIYEVMVSEAKDIFLPMVGR